MSDYNQLYPQGLHLSPDQQDLLLAALSSNNPSHKPHNAPPQIKSEQHTSPGHASSNSLSAPPSGSFDNTEPHTNAFGFADDESPFLDFNPDVDFEFPDSEDLIGDLPGSGPTAGDYELGEKRKSMDEEATTENGETGKKRRESEGKKPGRKPLTSEPTTKRKAQNRAAQRAFRERKEKHLRDLETKVEELQQSSDMANQQNGLLRAQIGRLQVELREYRKRLSWVTSNQGVSAMSAIPGAHSRGARGVQNGEFLFDFPKFGDLPGGHVFNNGNAGKNDQSKPKDNTPMAPGVLTRETLANPANSPSTVKSTPSSASRTGSMAQSVSSPVGAGNVRSNTSGSNGIPSGAAASARSTYPSLKSSTGTTQDTSTSDSPSSSSDSHQSQLLSSSGTSPEPSANSPRDSKTNNAKQGNDCGCGPSHSTIDGEKSFCAQLGLACGSINNPTPAAREHSAKATSVSNIPLDLTERSTDELFGFDWLTQQNGGQFDPVLFGDWREPQDAVLSQDFGTFFNDAFPLPDLGSPSHNFTEVASEAPKKDLLSQIDDKLDEEVVPGEDQSKMLSCTKIWDRLQSMEKFRNGEIDVDNLCSELRTKARCSEGGVVVNQEDVEDIMGRAK